MTQGYRDLIVWQKGKLLCISIYKLTQQFPDDERFGSTNQLRRASVSIPSNIAEGSKRKGQKDQKHFFTMAYGSGAEIETQLDITKSLFPKLKHDIELLEPLLDEIMKMLHRLSN